ncbi:MAG: acetyl-CoA carboxylase biotin carboxylase subunit [Candidatus Schekmanbacteria bacterium RIFCSPHIGHO2_02_FULL_38_11]|uniref:Acetyl-CoA carboxylase biotin carboxylase subunit n=1 Tax=Candidatus Schekmanbacteria bacterium RIFCSPLOWO2_12_FULL_38_15 TaxID=1817883 RepID=A0A1F7SID0_9BACT|nr:MAG: acetyl-CoA carboxylase biotin carboxylase subunit [Candidatus Schekmanbacteria bacterium GWA2_38_9]OGL49621.1 MAG: acetyl-CoA carboxylase biotin carboxylase subunit [Candidatus Schekmanbacteria bacterium RIFCSPLOWO2_02_FULL_38_14]OGL50343.1 MAG: acetyl-CoA carboxylase biotin carboxylase subunit [Candidatus Schekmanbacteria bacterium RIFCSPHIGHO2_02_FULL_38_11]OGL52974.1 MAG: acetyl-CoA carboxylase biotin carboxylase subunit [Candidatus Schekmanbacteria bacterium RIFCSPLOWO2_12_FULL_38_15
MFKKILISNRGEIAIRIIRACQDLNIPTVAVYSKPDRNSLHVGLADEAYCIGEAASIKSYLNIDKIISVAKESGADAIHPGYGFLSENSRFAQECEKEKITFIGPSSDVIEKMGNKTTARKIMAEAGIPILPGTTESIENDDEVFKIAKEIGFPIMIKAAAGGGGKGMRIVHTENELKSSVRAARSEAGAAFGNSSVYVEKYLENPRHIEIQVLADKHGNSVHLFERECSIQRRHQKIIEETPSTVVDDKLRERMGIAALKAVKAVNYTNAGTVEFLVDKKNNFYFLEMNTRLQVEHAITEIVTGIDIVREQIRIASGEKLKLTQDKIKRNGCAMECRIYAEDPEKNFLPSPGIIRTLRSPGGYGIRYDSSAYEGCNISVHYDPLISKLVVWGKDREEARMRMLRALNEYSITGIKTTIPFLKKVISNKHFIEGDIDTNFIAKRIEPSSFPSDEALKIAILTAVIESFKKAEKESLFHDQSHQPKNHWKVAGKWQMWGSRL